MNKVLRSSSFRKRLLSTAVTLLFLAKGALVFSQEPKPHPPVKTVAIEEIVVQEGIAVTFDVRPVKKGDPPAAGVDAEVRFSITDTNSGTPLSALSPAAWVDPRDTELPSGRDLCRAKMERFVSGALGVRAELDLNAFYVLTLNDEPTIAVVDPLFSFGGTKLLAMVFLKSPGWDWAMNADQTRLYVSLPDVSQVAVVETGTWKVIDHVDTGKNPRNLGLQPDGRYLWVTHDGEENAGGVTVIDTITRKGVTRIPTGAGPHALTFDREGRFAFVTNRSSGDLTVIDSRQHQIVSQIATGKAPVALDYSSLSGAVYVSDALDGTVTVVDASRHTVRAVIEARPGLGALRLAPGGRFGFALNGPHNEVHIFDSASNRMLQTASVGDHPDQISFTDTLAYVRSLGDELVLMIPLDGLGVEGAPVPVVDFSGGQLPAGRAKVPMTPPAIVAAPGGGAVLVANPADQAVYYYREGMAAPMGSFRNYGGRPRAVMVLDNSLREIEPGVYATRVRLPEAGLYDAAFFLDSPRIIHCFDFPIDPHPDQRKAKATPVLEPQYWLQDGPVSAGHPFTLSFRLKNKERGTPLIGLRDVEVLVFQSGNWHDRRLAEPGQDGVYQVGFTVPKGGSYYAFLACPSLKVTFEQTRPFIFKTTAGRPAITASHSTTAGQEGDQP